MPANANFFYRVKDSFWSAIDSIGSTIARFRGWLRGDSELLQKYTYQLDNSHIKFGANYTNGDEREYMKNVILYTMQTGRVRKYGERISIFENFLGIFKTRKFAKNFNNKEEKDECLLQLNKDIKRSRCAFVKDGYTTNKDFDDDSISNVENFVNDVINKLNLPSDSWISKDYLFKIISNINQNIETPYYKPFIDQRGNILYALNNDKNLKKPTSLVREFNNIPSSLSYIFNADTCTVEYLSNRVFVLGENYDDMVDKVTYFNTMDENKIDIKSFPSCVKMTLSFTMDLTQLDPNKEANFKKGSTVIKQIVSYESLDPNLSLVVNANYSARSKTIEMQLRDYQQDMSVPSLWSRITNWFKGSNTKSSAPQETVSRKNSVSQPTLVHEHESSLVNPVPQVNIPQPDISVEDPASRTAARSESSINDNVRADSFEFDEAKVDHVSEIDEAKHHAEEDVDLVFVNNDRKENIAAEIDPKEEQLDAQQSSASASSESAFNKLTKKSYTPSGGVAADTDRKDYRPQNPSLLDSIRKAFSNKKSQ